MNKIKEISIAVCLALMLSGIIMQPVAAWGGVTHTAITSQLNEVPDQVTSYMGFTKGGGIGPDMFYYLPGMEYYSTMAHTRRTRPAL